MAGVGGPFAGAGNPRRREDELSLPRRIGSWLVWWVILMSFWVWLDNSIGLAELVVGAIVAVFGASLAELVQYQANTRIRIRIEWLAHAIRLPYEIGRDTGIVFAALLKKVLRGEEPNSGFRLVAVEAGDESPEAVTRRVLLIGGTSIAPNTFVLGLDAEQNVMVVHQLVLSSREDDAQEGGRK